MAEPFLTIGMAARNDPFGVYMTLQALRLYHPDATSEGVELVVMDDTGPVGDSMTAEMARKQGARYQFIHGAVCGSAPAKNRLMAEALGKWVLCMDAHVMLFPGALQHLITFLAERPDSSDIYHGPLIYDDLKYYSTHFNENWSNGMWGQWAQDKRAEGDEPFEIPMMGMGLFCIRKEAWPKFNERMRGFGGEEGYIHEKIKKAGHKAWCLPWLKWVHRFRCAHEPAPYPASPADQFFNYLVGFTELGKSLEPVYEHFKRILRPDEYTYILNDAQGTLPPVPEQPLISTGEAQMPARPIPAMPPGVPLPPGVMLPPGFMPGQGIPPTPEVLAALGGGAIPPPGSLPGSPMMQGQRLAQCPHNNLEIHNETQKKQHPQGIIVFAIRFSGRCRDCGMSLVFHPGQAKQTDDGIITVMPATLESDHVVVGKA